MNNGGIVVAAIVGVLLAILIWTFSYQACRVKFPDAPAWACIVKP